MEGALAEDGSADANVRRLAADGDFELSTVFAEFWAGHGWSLPQSQVERRTEAQVRDALAMCAVGECVCR